MSYTEGKRGSGTPAGGHCSSPDKMTEAALGRGGKRKSCWAQVCFGGGTDLTC